MQGRSPTCYSPVRHSSTPKGLSVRLACVKHAASVRPEPESNSPNKNFRLKQSDPNKPVKTGKKTTTPPKREKRECGKNKNNKQKPPNTLLSSQTTHPLGRATSPRQKPRTRSADDQEPTEVGLPSGSRRALRAGPVSQRRVNKLREGKLGVKWADRACLSARHLSCAPGCVGSDNMFNAAVPEIVPDRAKNRPKPLAPTSYPTRSTPAIFRLPRRSTSQRPCKKSAGCGTHSSLSIRTLLT